MLKTIKETQVEYKRLVDLELGMVTPDGIVIGLDLNRMVFTVPMGDVRMEPDQVVAVLCKITEFMAEHTKEVVEAERPASQRLVFR